ncbi:30S ribosomal protein S20 [Patescibacteria group bacterium]|nr:30S ribosomal protein S20 [Patescibacteria group bacterium]
MPIKQAAFKALRQTKRRTARNKKIKAGLEISLRQARQALNEPAKAVDQIKLAIQAIDRAAQKKTLKANTAARKKSRLMKAYNKAKQIKK